ncbi:hypothetical protein I546_4268 [Mycobacterium kansasii 732]|nr:hypothetical protein I546_4268 [Mycobacterium kansasii 732]
MRAAGGAALPATFAASARCATVEVTGSWYGDRPVLAGPDARPHA